MNGNEMYETLKHVRAELDAFYEAIEDDELKALFSSAMHLLEYHAEQAVTNKRMAEIDTEDD